MPSQFVINNMATRTLAGLLIIIAIVAGIAYYFRDRLVTNNVNSFAECNAAGYTISGSYPRECKTPDGRTFRETVSNNNNQNQPPVTGKEDLIRVTVPLVNIAVKSPLTVEGEARGNWYFEASFPVRVYDGNGKLLGTGIAQAQGEWMTTNFVPFKATVMFSTPTTATGTLVLEKDNPSGLPENADELRIPIIFIR
jgi:hypothetical protein